MKEYIEQIEEHVRDLRCHAEVGKKVLLVDARLGCAVLMFDGQLVVRKVLQRIKGQLGMVKHNSSTYAVGIDEHVPRHQNANAMDDQDD